MDNLNIYNKVRTVPEEAQKQFNNGRFSGTDINPMWRIKTLTEQFGPCGIGWYYEETDRWTEQGTGGSVMAFMSINLYVKVEGEWSKPIMGTGGNMLLDDTKRGLRNNDEAYKMALTDALGVAAKSLGVGADIYFEKDSTKYTREQERKEEEEREQKADLAIAMDELKYVKTIEELTNVWNRWKAQQANPTFKNAVAHIGKQLKTKKDEKERVAAI